MLAIIPSGALHGIAAQPVSVEVNTGEAGKPEIVLVGLPDASVKESEHYLHVTSAIFMQFIIPHHKFHLYFYLVLPPFLRSSHLRHCLGSLLDSTN